MSPTIGLPPPVAEGCLVRSRKSSCRGGTLIAEDVVELDEHRRRVVDPDRYRPAECARCGHRRLHVHCHLERRPRGEPSLPVAIAVLQFRCAREDCGATWRILPLFLARHLWHAWKAVQRIARPGAAPTTPRTPPISTRTQQRWRARLASSARVLVAVLATSVDVVLEEVAMRVGLDGTRGELVEVFGAATAPPGHAWLSPLAALIHRLERGIRLM